jgi:hypothetical protein
MYTPFLKGDVSLFLFSICLLLLLVHVLNMRRENKNGKKMCPFSFKTTLKIETEKGSYVKSFKYMSAYTSHLVLSRPGPASPAISLFPLSLLLPFAKQGRWGSPEASNIKRRKPGAASASSSAPC